MKSLNDVESFLASTNFARLSWGVGVLRLTQKRSLTSLFHVFLADTECLPASVVEFRVHYRGVEMARDLRSFVNPILTCFAIICLCVGATLSHAKECTNVPTQYVSHTLRARGLEKLTPEEASGGKFITTLVRSFRKFLVLEGYGGEFEHSEVQKDSSKVDSTSGGELESEVLLDIDDWGKTWVTITKPLIKYTRKRAAGSKHGGEKLSTHDLGSLEHDGSSKSSSSVPWTSNLSEENVSKPSFAAGFKQLKEVSLNKVRAMPKVFVTVLHLQAFP